LPGGSRVKMSLSPDYEKGSDTELDRVATPMRSESCGRSAASLVRTITWRSRRIASAAWGALTGSNYPPLPRDFHGPYLELRAYFLYNMEKR